MINPESLAVLTSAVAVALTEGRSNEEVALLASILVQISDTMATIVTARDINELLTKTNSDAAKNTGNGAGNGSTDDTTDSN